MNFNDESVANRQNYFLLPTVIGKDLLFSLYGLILADCILIYTFIDNTISLLKESFRDICVKVFLLLF